MNTELEIHNYALSLIGSEPYAEGDSSKRARLCATFYPTVRDSLLRNHVWKFAYTTTTLVQVTNPNEAEADARGNKFQLPADCVRVVELHNYDGEYLVIGGYVYAFVDTLSITYVTNAQTPSYYSPDFTQLLALGLAVELSYPMVQSNALHERLLAKYERMIKDVRFNNAVGQSTQSYAGETYIAGRLM